jgi:hypothetical protein
MKIISILRSKILFKQNPFLNDDSNLKLNSSYPYPAKLPSFLARLGISELKSWKNTAIIRKNLLSELMEIVKKSNMKNNLPSSYFDKKREVIPLRLAWYNNDGELIRKKLSEIIDISWIWFMSPIVSTDTELEYFYYYPGLCPISEKIGPKMVNLPCNINPTFKQLFLNKFEFYMLKNHYK